MMRPSIQAVSALRGMAVLHAGWLDKWPVSGWGRQARRFFVLRGCAIEYYADDSTSAPAKGVYTLSFDSSVKAGDAFKFTVHTSDGHTLQLRAADAADQEAWLAAIRDVIGALREECGDDAEGAGHAATEDAMREGELHEVQYDLGGFAVPGFGTELSPRRGDAVGDEADEKEEEKGDFFAGDFLEDMVDVVIDDDGGGDAPWDGAGSPCDLPFRQRQVPVSVSVALIGYYKERKQALAGARGRDMLLRKPSGLPQKPGYLSRPSLSPPPSPRHSEGLLSNGPIYTKDRSTLFGGGSGSGPATPDGDAKGGSVRWKFKATKKDFMKLTSGDDAPKEPRGDNMRVLEKWAEVFAKWITLSAARVGDRRMLGLSLAWLDRAKPGIDKDEPNLLRAACRHKHIECVRYLVEERGVDVNGTNGSGAPVVWFCLLGLHAEEARVKAASECFHYLLERGADPTVLNAWGQNIMFWMARTNSPKIGRFMQYMEDFVIVDKQGKERRIDPCQRDKFGSSIMHTAVLYGNRYLVAHLLEKSFCADLLCRSDWAGALDMISDLGLAEDEHITARNSWPGRGLMAAARRLSPLGVAILHNQEAVAQLLVAVSPSTPGGCARRAAVFRDDNEDLALLARAWPSLVPAVLDATDVTVDEQAAGGYVVQTLRLHDWFGDPATRNVYDTPLAILSRSGRPEVLAHPVANLVIHMKWKLFGQRMYIMQLLRYAVVLVSYFLGFIIFPEQGYPWPTVMYARWACFWLCVFLFMKEELVKMAKSRWRYLASPYNWMALASYVCIAAMVPQQALAWQDHASHHDTKEMRALGAVAGALLFLRVLEFLAVLSATGAFVAMLRRVLLDAAKWSGVFLLLLSAFAVAFYSLLHGEDGFSRFGESFFSVFGMSIGEFDYPFHEDRFINDWACAFFAVFVVLVHLLYLNVLIAMMASSYKAVSEDARASASFNRAALLLRYEVAL
uniref:PH domain-containing protein n=1 Tax=Phaeomonas parva TaxID=124430 RepID=A0A7S1TW52_9STRA|mmetsp:Transcript_20386/g.61936  ORF Transcript_20386/g.61936 Transcript_20386/m.61936 type:complete len:961 (+) Transcript_20386:369-3251(+)